jgi:predicted phosphodiesterase
MRILLLADIHANWAALDAIREPHDVCVCLGDLVDYGPDGAACVDWVRSHAHYVIRGNHDHAVAQNINGSGDDGYRYLARATRPLMWEQLSTEQRTYLARLPVSLDVTLGDTHFHFVHATPRDPLDEYLLDDVPQWERRLRGTHAQFVCVGHTHRQFDIHANGCRVVNPGSVGQPRDGDPRAAYAVVEGGQVELKRVEYPIDRTISALAAASIPERAKDLSALVLLTGGANFTGNRIAAPPACRIGGRVAERLAEPL